MAKQSLTAQFDEIQAQLEAHGLTVRRSDKFDVRGELLLQPPTPRGVVALATINIKRRRDKSAVEGWTSIYGVYDTADDSDKPADVLASLLAKPFGRTTVGAVFGL